MPDYRTPGVIIEEQPATGPIAGVGTSTVALLGPALSGPINIPTKITNWTQFTEKFGEYLIAPRLYLPHAVRGFFDNGGTVAYIVRVGTGVRAFFELDDRGAGAAAGKALRIEAKQEGADGNTIQVAVQDAQIVAAGNNALVRKARATIAAASNNSIRLQTPADVALFRPGDVITIEGSAERAQIDRIRGAELVLLSNLTAAYAAGTFVRIANLAVNQKTFRVQNSASIEPGSVIQLGAVSEYYVVDSIMNDFVTLAGTGLKSAFPLGQGDADVAVTTFEFNLVVTKQGPPAITERFSNLSMDQRHSRYFARIVNSTLVNVSLPRVPSVQGPPANRPAVVVATSLQSGANDTLGAVGLNEYQAGLTALERISDVSLICVPGRTDQGVQQAVVAHCQNMKDRFAILDSAFNAPPTGTGVGSILDQRGPLVSALGFAALYYPWIVMNDPVSRTGTDTFLMPPSGHIAGIYARSDNQRGVHKAPANEFITGAVNLERLFNDADHGELNIEGINVLRIFPGQRPIVWGARTTAPRDATPWRYVNVRRLFIFIEKSLQDGLRWAVFEPNDPSLWKKLERTISEFLTRVWRSGALFGRKADEAFYVKIDKELNPPSVQELGQIIIEIGIAPVRPAEFVIVRIAMWDGGSQMSEG